MSQQRRGPGAGLRAPAGRGARGKRPDRGKGITQAKLSDTERHAEEIKAVARGKSIVEKSRFQTAKKPPAFDREQLMAVRAWLQIRPFEANPTASPLVKYPRMWTTKRGRYCRFRSPAAGVYGLLRARPTF